MNPVLSPPVQSDHTVTQVVGSSEGNTSDQPISYTNDYNLLVDEACTYIMNKQLPAVERFLLVLLLRNGLRVSEICNGGNIKLQDKYKALVYCSKNNVWRTCTTAEASELLSDNSVIMDLPIWKRNRQYYYRQLKGLLPNVETSRTGNEAVTHAARNIVAQQVMEATGSMQATKSAIGNTSDRATEKYISKSQRRTLQKGGIKDNISGNVSGINATKSGVLRRRKL